MISLTSNDDNNNNPQGLPTVRVQVIDLAEEQELELQTLNLQAAESWVPVPSLSPLPDPEVQDFTPMPLPMLNEEVNQELLRRETHRSCTGCHLPCTTDLQHWCLGCQILCPYHQYAYRRNLTVYWSPTHPGSSELTCHLASRVGPATPPPPTGTDPSGDFRTDPTAPEETSSSEKGDPPRPAARGSRKLHPDPAYENLEFATGAGYTGGAKPKKAVVQQPKSILRTPDTGTKKKTVQYTPSTKRGRSVSTKRPPTPDLEVSIRPTSTWDIVDEVLAGQPTKTKAGKTVPDTLIQISEPTPHDQAKKPKKVLTRSDRILRSKK